MSDYQLAQVAIMHYENGLSQQEIANMFGHSKMTVSRMLQKAKDKNIVKTEVALPFDLDSTLEGKLKSKFDLSRATVIKTKAVDQDLAKRREEVAKAAAFFFNTSLIGNSTIGIGIGRTVGQIVRHISPMKSDNVHIVQLMGGLPDVTRENPFTIIQETCRKLEATGTFLTSFATADSKDVKENFISHNETGKLVSELWEKCDLAIFGVGMIENGTLLSPKLVSSEEMGKLKKLNAIGDILGHWFTAEGEFVQSELEDRLVSIPIGLLERIKIRRAAVVGDEKVPAILGALKTGLINEIFTDRHTALLLCK